MQNRKRRINMHFPLSSSSGTVVFRRSINFLHLMVQLFSLASTSEFNDFAHMGPLEDTKRTLHQEFLFRNFFRIVGWKGKSGGPSSQGGQNHWIWIIWSYSNIDTGTIFWGECYAFIPDLDDLESLSLVQKHPTRLRHRETLAKCNTLQNIQLYYQEDLL